MQLIHQILLLSSLLLLSPSTTAGGNPFTVQKYSDKRVNDQCVKELAYWTKLATDNPNDEYYKFKLAKVRSRCIVKQK